MIDVGKRFSDEQKAEAVARALSGEVTKRQVADDVGVSETTLYRWIDSQRSRSNVAHLRAVPPAEEGPPKKAVPKTIAEAAASGDYRATLANLRDRLAKTLDDPNTPPRDLASTSRRFLEVCREIDAIDARVAEEAREDAEATPDDEWEAV